MKNKFTFKTIVVAFMLLLSVAGKVNAQTKDTANSQKLQLIQKSNLQTDEPSVTPAVMTHQPVPHQINLIPLTQQMSSEKGTPIPDKANSAAPSEQNKSAVDKQSPDLPQTAAAPQTTVPAQKTVPPQKN